MEIYSISIVEKNPVPKSQTKPFYIGTKEAPSDKSGYSFIVLERKEHQLLFLFLRTCDNSVFNTLDEKVYTLKVNILEIIFK